MGADQLEWCVRQMFTRQEDQPLVAEQTKMHSSAQPGNLPGALHTLLNTPNNVGSSAMGLEQEAAVRLRREAGAEDQCERLWTQDVAVLPASELIENDLAGRQPRSSPVRPPGSP